MLFTIAIGTVTFAILVLSYLVCGTIRAAITENGMRDAIRDTKAARDGGIMYGGHNRPGQD